MNNFLFQTGRHFSITYWLRSLVVASLVLVAASAQVAQAQELEPRKDNNKADRTEVKLSIVNAVGADARGNVVGYVSVNNDNDDNDNYELADKRFDLKDDDGVKGEDDLVEVIIHPVTAEIAGDKKFYLEFDKTRIKVWESKDKTPNTDVKALGEAQQTAFTPTVEHRVWVEGVSAVEADASKAKLTLWLSNPARTDIGGDFDANFYVFEVRVRRIDGLYKADTTPVFTQAVAGLPVPQDVQGRVYNNRAYDTNAPEKTKWAKNKQYVDIQCEILPTTLPLPVGSSIVWKFKDPDDPSDDESVDPASAKILDPGDYDGVDGDGDGQDKDLGDNLNLPTDNVAEQPRWSEIRGTIDEPLADASTRIVAGNGGNHVSKVRFNVSDHSGDNFRVNCNVRVGEGDQARTVGGGLETGLLTVWTKIDIEHVRMQGADYSAADRLSSLNGEYAKTFIQFVFSPEASRDVPAVASFGDTFDVANEEVDTYVGAEDEGGNFKNKKKGGWFFLVSALLAQPRVPGGNTAMYTGRAKLTTPKTGPNTGISYVTLLQPELYDGTKLPQAVFFGNGAGHNTYFEVSGYAGESTLSLRPKEYHAVTRPRNPEAWANLFDYQLMTPAENPDDRMIVIAPRGSLNTYGSAPGNPGFSGKMVLFTQWTPADKALAVLTHEFAHALGFAHKCGNWDHRKPQGRASCTGNYDEYFMLKGDLSQPPLVRKGDGITAPWTEPWTDSLVGPSLCAAHIVAMRNRKLEDDGILNWPESNG